MLGAMIARPSAAFFLLAGAVALAHAAYGWFDWPAPMVGYLPVIALLTGGYGASWLAFELVARRRAKRWLGWLSFAFHAVSVALSVFGQYALNAWEGRSLETGVMTTDVPWAVLGSSALMLGGYLAAVSLAPILPAIMLAIFQPGRAAPQS